MTIVFLKATFWAVLALLVYVYRVYEWLLRAASALGPKARSLPASERAAPRLTVLITVHNEVGRIEQRIANVFACAYPRDRLEVLVASDGSDDGTDRLVTELAAAHPVRLFASGGRFGKTETQNRALEEARGEIIVFTDAVTEFAPDFLVEIVRPLDDPAVGMTTGRIELMDATGVVARSQGSYWSFEMRVRDLESRLGILAVASGQAMAVRKALIRPMDPAIGEDCIVPLDVALQGSRIVHCRTAVARDVFEAEPAKELSTRIRMTLRNWQGTWSRRRLLDPLRHPGYALALWSHKILRWLSPFYMLAATVCLAALAREPLYLGLAALAALGYFGAAVGWLGGLRGMRIPVATQLYSFVLANVGFAIGVTRALLGHEISVYRSGTLEGSAPRQVADATRNVSYEPEAWVAGVMLLVCMVYYLSYFNYGIDLDDEGFLLANAASVLHGGWPIADYYSYPPLSYWVLALAFRAFGELVIVERVLLMCFLLVNVFLVFWIARRALPLWWALFPVALYAAAPGPWYKLFFIFHFLLIAAATLYLIDRLGRHRGVLLGLALGVALIGRIEAAAVGVLIVVPVIGSMALLRPEGQAAFRDISLLRKLVGLGAACAVAAALPLAAALAAYAAAGKLPLLLHNLDHYYNLVGSADYVNTLSGREDRYSLLRTLRAPSRELVAYTFGLAAGALVCIMAAFRLAWRGPDSALWFRRGAIGLFALGSMGYTYFYVWNSRMLSSFPLVYIAIAIVTLTVSDWLRERLRRPVLAYTATAVLLGSTLWCARGFAKVLDFYSGSYTTIIRGSMARVNNPRLKGVLVYQDQAEVIRDLMRLTAGAPASEYLVPMSEATTMGFLSGLHNPTYYRLFLSEFAPLGERQRAIETFERLKIRYFVARRSQFLPGGPQLGSDLKRYAPEIRRYLIAHYEILPLGSGFVLLERKAARSSKPG
jgi:glycosyltransferase involved in cell wall biosynthesis